MDCTVLYGASDDLVEIDGEIRDEVNSEPITFRASDGTKGRILYGEGGNWIIELKQRGNLLSRLIFAVGDDKQHTDEVAKNYSSYSDILIWGSGLDWLKVGGKTFKPLTNKQNH